MAFIEKKSFEQGVKENDPNLVFFFVNVDGEQFFYKMNSSDSFKYFMDDVWDKFDGVLMAFWYKYDSISCDNTPQKIGLKNEEGIQVQRILF